MKIVEYANTHAGKNIVIIAKTMDQVSYIRNTLRRNLICMAIEKSTIRLHNGTKILTYPEYTSANRFRGISIHVLLFAGVEKGTRDMIEKHLLHNMVAVNSGPNSVRLIIGELKV